MFFRQGQRQIPEVWIKQRGAITIRQAMLHFNMTEENASAMLTNLVKQKRLISYEQDGVSNGAPLAYRRIRAAGVGRSRFDAATRCCLRQSRWAL